MPPQPLVIRMVGLRPTVGQPQPVHQQFRHDGGHDLPIITASPRRQVPALHDPIYDWCWSLLHIKWPMTLIALTLIAYLLGGFIGIPGVASMGSYVQGAAGGVASGNCSGTFTSITASAYVDALNLGWNLGNTLDAPDEGAWNNPPVVPTTFDDVKAAGFKSVRIPVTYTNHYTGASPNWTINSTWLQRVSDVIDMATSRGLYVVTNMHHDSWMWADVTKPDANISMIQEKFQASWVQIGTKLACKSSMVAFEPINEPPATTEAHSVLINQFNTLFLKALAASGGFNTQRVVTLVGAGEDGPKTTQWFKLPPNMTNPWALQYHYYSPYDFSMSAWGKTIWGSADDKKAMDTDLAIVRGNFTDVPIIIGEYDACPTNCEAAGRWKWFDHLVRQANHTKTALILWDNGADHFDRAAHRWRDPTLIDIIMNAVKGVSNSLPDSTTDGSATSQLTSAYIFHRVGTPIVDQTLPFIFSGNTLSSIHVGGAGASLSSTADYTVSSSAITFKSSFLSNHISPTASPGVRGNLTLNFSAGAPLAVEIVEWDVPVFSSIASKAVAGSDLKIPILYKGLVKVAAVKIVRSDGTYPFDDWTKYLGPLQQGRGTFENHWRWDDESVTITSGAIESIISGGKSATFTFEFYPRVPGNAVNYTLTV